MEGILVGAGAGVGGASGGRGAGRSLGGRVCDGCDQVHQLRYRGGKQVNKHLDPMTEMWTALELYQPYAEKYGFGDAWRRMTTERTVEAAEHAHEASPNVYMEGTDFAGLAAIEAIMPIHFYNQNQIESARSKAQYVIDKINTAIAIELENKELESVNETSNIAEKSKMNKIETGVTLEVYPDPMYFYEIHVNNAYAHTLTYVEKQSDKVYKESERVYISFGSLEEMEAVANAMLKAAKIKREMGS